MAWSDEARRAALEARRLHRAQKGKGSLTLYRGTTPGDTRRISTGVKDWDAYLFASSRLSSAQAYGKSIEVFKSKKGASILFEGTRKFQSVAKGLGKKNTNLLTYSNAVAKAARAAGFSAVHFQRQGDVGTAILDRSKFRSRKVRSK